MNPDKSSQLDKSDKTRSFVYSRKSINLHGGCPKDWEKHLNFPPSMFSITLRDKKLDNQGREPPPQREQPHKEVGRGDCPSAPALSYLRAPSPIQPSKRSLISV